MHNAEEIGKALDKIPYSEYYIHTKERDFRFKDLPENSFINYFNSETKTHEMKDHNNAILWVHHYKPYAERIFFNIWIPWFNGQSSGHEEVEAGFISEEHYLEVLEYFQIDYLDYYVNDKKRGKTNIQLDETDLFKMIEEEETEEEQEDVYEVKKTTVKTYMKEGYKRQVEFRDRLIKDGFKVEGLNFFKSEPDIVARKDNRYLVVSVKSFALDKLRRNGHTNSRTIKRNDLTPEINETLKLIADGYETQLKLAICNTLNDKWEIIDINLKSFTHYSTKEELATL